MMSPIKPLPSTQVLSASSFSSQSQHLQMGVAGKQTMRTLNAKLARLTLTEDADG
jgi:hypothetical protein